MGDRCGTGGNSGVGAGQEVGGTGAGREEWGDRCETGMKDRCRAGGWGTGARKGDRATGAGQGDGGTSAGQKNGETHEGQGDGGTGARQTLQASSGVERVSSAWSVLSLGLSNLGTNVTGRQSARSGSPLLLMFFPSSLPIFFSGDCTELPKNSLIDVRTLEVKWNILILAQAETHTNIL